LALALLAGLAYRQLLFWDPSAPGLPDVGWFFFGMHDTAPQIVFAIAALLLYQRRGRLALVPGRKGSPLLASPLLGTGFALYLWAHHVDAPDLLLVSFLPFCLGSALLLCGAQFTREMAFPILFLVFALPIPGVVTNQIVFPLQLWNAELVAQLLAVGGIPVVREGDMLYLADRSFEIIENCSGLRAIVVLTMLAAGLACYFRAGWPHLLLLVASACAIAYGLNAARVLTVVLYPESEESVTHALQGMVLFFCGGAALFAIDVVLRRWLGGRGIPARSMGPAATPSGRESSGGVGRVMALATLLASMLAVSIWMPRWSSLGSEHLPGIDLPERIGSWEASETLEPDQPFLGSVHLQAHRYRRYRRSGETVSVFVAQDDLLNRSRSLLSPKSAFPGRGWEAEERGPVELGPDGFKAVRVAARSRASRMLTYHWYHGIEGLGAEVVRAWLATDRSFLRRRTAGLVIRLEIELPSAGEERLRAEASLHDCAELLLPIFDEGGGVGTAFEPDTRWVMAW
jgi:exosortase